MNNNITEIIKERILKLPPYIQEAIKKVDWGKEITEIGKRQGLHVDELGILQTETVMVLVGLVHPNEYPNELRKALGSSKEKIDALVTEVNEHILKGIRDMIIEFMAKEAADAADPMGSSGVEIIAAPTQVESTEVPHPESGAEQAVLEKSGVAIDTPPPINDAPVPTEERKDILQNVEHPQKTGATPFSQMVAEKLGTSTTEAPQKNSYVETSPATAASEANQKEPTPPAPPSYGTGDPYREPVA